MATNYIFIDGRPIFYDRDGNPLIYGKAFFYDVGTTNPKTVYTDKERTTPSYNPLILNNYGRPDNQIFLDYGLYTIHVYKFNGTDPQTAEDNEWSLDNEFILDGGSEPVLETSIITVANIAELRLVDQSSYSVARVLGYYAAGDMFTRMYQLKTNSDVDNGGTVVKNPSISNKSWFYIPDSQEVDARVFGLIPDSLSTYNSMLQSSATWCYNNNKTLYIPSGLYYFAAGSIDLYCALSVDDGVRFRCDVVGDSYTVNVYGEYDIRLTNAFEHPSSTGDVFLYINASSSGAHVSPRWYGAELDNATDDYDALDRMISQTRSKSALFLFDGVARVSSGESDLEFVNDIKFISESGIYNNQSTCYIVFKSIKIDNKNNGGYNTIPHPLNVLNGQLDGFYFEECTEVLSSYFGAATQGNTADLCEIIGNIQSSYGTAFVFDMPVNLFSGASGVSITNGSRWNFRHQSGVIQNSHATSVVYLNNLDATAGKYCIAPDGNVIILNGDIHYTWFLRPSATTQDRKDGYTYSLRCAVFGSGSLDLDGSIGSSDLFPIIDARSNQIDNTISSESSRGISIFNGRVLVTSSSSYLIDIDSISVNVIRIKDVSIAAAKDVSCGFVKANLCSVFNCIVENSKSRSLTIGTTSVFELSSSSFSGEMIISNTYARGYYLFGGTSYTIPSARVVNCDMYETNIQVPSPKGMLISGTRAFNIYPESSSARVYGTVCNCEVFGEIKVVASDANTILSGIKIIDNYCSSVTAAGTFLVSSSHKALIRNNETGVTSAPATEGVTKVSISYDATGLGVGDTLSCDISTPSELFTLASMYDTGFRSVARVNSIYFIVTFAAPFGVGNFRVNLLIVKSGFSSTGTLDVDIAFKSFNG